MRTTPWKGHKADSGTDGVGALVWLLTIAFLIVSGILFLLAGFRLHPAFAAYAASTTGTGALAAWLLERQGKAPRLARMISGFFQAAIVGFAGMLLAYAAATMARPLVDHELIVIDHALGYDWTAYAAYFANRPSLSQLVVPSYWAIFIQPPVLFAALAASAHGGRLQAYLLANLSALVLTIALFAFFPATTAWAHLHIPDADIARLRYLPLTGEGWIRDLLDLRDGGGRLLDRPGSPLIAFPSFHCVSALLFVWAAWPVRWLRFLLLPVNAAMLAATPLVGGHYLADLIGGGLITLVSVAASRHGIAAFRRSRESRSVGLGRAEAEPVPQLA